MCRLNTQPHAAVRAKHGRGWHLELAVWAELHAGRRSGLWTRMSRWLAAERHVLRLYAGSRRRLNKHLGLRSLQLLFLQRDAALKRIHCFQNLAQRGRLDLPSPKELDRAVAKFHAVSVDLPLQLVDLILQARRL